MNEIDTFREYLARHRLKMTQERKAILEEAFRIQGHFDADDLLLRFRRMGRPVSRATIYRTLGHLLDSGLLRKVVVGQGQALYEPVHGREHHDHLVCLGCGKLIEFSNDDIEELQSRVCREHGFRMTRHVHQILGYCQACDQEGERSQQAK